MIYFFRSHNEWLKYLKLEQFFFKIFTTNSPYFLQYGKIIHKRRLNRSFGITNKHLQYKLAPYANGMEKRTSKQQHCLHIKINK